MFHIVELGTPVRMAGQTVEVSAPPDLPELVIRALRLSLERGYMQASRTETGRLLAALAATRTGTIAECGTGCGVGAAWLRSGAPKTTRVITAELDPELAHGVMDMFAGDDIDVMHADWSSLAEHAPFSLIFMDATSAKGWPARTDRRAARGRRHDRFGRLHPVPDVATCRGRSGGYLASGLAFRRALHQR